MSTLAAKSLLVIKVLLAAALVCWGIWSAGYSRGHAVAQQGEMTRREAAIKRSIKFYEDELQAGERAAGSMREQLEQLRTSNDELNRRLANVPRFVSSPRCPNPGAVELSRAGVVRLNAAIGHPELPAGVGGDAGATAGAGAAADVAVAGEPAGGARDLAAGSGVLIEDAQRNAEGNFRRCAEIRARCQSLIDYIRERQDRNSAPSESDRQE